MNAMPFPSVPELFASAVPPLRRVIAELMPLREDGPTHLSPMAATAIAADLTEAGEAARLFEALSVDPDTVAYDLFAIAGAFEARAKSGCLVFGHEVRRLLSTLHAAVSTCERMEAEGVDGREWLRATRGRA